MALQLATQVFVIFDNAIVYYSNVTRDMWVSVDFGRFAMSCPARMRNTSATRNGFGINGLCVGVPVKLGAGGMEKIMEIALTEDERLALGHSAASVQELVEVMKKAKAEG